ncbi:XRE family transcriptional regulator [Salmonella enterica subsp. diarizonae]|uniref:helix-turn-helix domain-containing protein n=1 Tax=Salmonella enterica TaxID=28901 RepID=UPI000F9C32F8|nr:XRE family transcriptional regulator [Salmonella enterica]EDU8159101.1 helix-turn-helix transcriptional regulator [Salmonella enterica subsp. diarizonae]EAQ6113582.1 XRE family transcriptional regulator [Salmonella enterica]ECC6252956.1 helix-turn-helix transcriptional regulator [Salmonella enterica]EEA3033733.1 helix-turn-helix domain-containing protein [Salmonella enterica subsp. diarizonae]
MSTSIGKKIREIRETEGLTRKQFFELTGIPETAQKNYERGVTEKIGIDTVMKITNHPRFKKYTLWLMSEDDEAYSEAEQISPALSPNGQNSTSSRPKRKKAG